MPQGGNDIDECPGSEPEAFVDIGGRFGEISSIGVAQEFYFFIRETFDI